MRKAFAFILTLAAGYVGGALLGALVIAAVSSNRHDRDLEAAMTGAFVTGPMGILIAFIVFLWRR